MEDSVEKYIIVYGTEKFCKSDQGSYCDVLEDFIERTEWFLHYVTNAEGGLAVLARPPIEKKMDLLLRPPGYGAGTELKKLLSRIGIQSTPNCSCNRKADAMDAMGIEWCIDNQDKILGWLREETEHRLQTYEGALQQIKNTVTDKKEQKQHIKKLGPKPYGWNVITANGAKLIIKQSIRAARRHARKLRQ